MRKLGNIEYKWLVAAAFVFGIFMDLLDLTVVNVALPTFGRIFHASAADLEWVVTGYLLSLAIWIPASGWIGDTIGTKKTFIFALGMFVIGSGLCGIAWNIDSLIFFRILQGVGGGMLTPVGTAMLFRAFPAHERAQASIVLMIPTVISPTIGPVLGGFFVDYLSWHWIFFVNLPIGIFGIIFTALFIEEEKQENAGRFDLPGFLFSGAGLALILFALSRGPEDGWTSALVLATGLTGVALFVALVYVELHTPEPMLDLRILINDRMFRSANIVFFLMMGGLIGFFFILTLFLQNLRGYSAVDTGLMLVPSSIMVAMFAPLVGKLFPVVGPRRLLAFALTLFALSSALFLLVDLKTSSWIIIGILIVRGIAMAFTFIPLQAAAFSTITLPSMGRASSIFNTDRQVASSIGVAILATVLTERLAHYMGAAFGAGGANAGAAAQHASLLAFHDAFLASAVMALVGIIFALMIHDEDAAASMRQQAAGEFEPAGLG